jgi:hypothetical protein
MFSGGHDLAFSEVRDRMADPFLGPYREIRRLRQQARRVLGVTDEAGPQEIRAAFRRLARERHPDRTGRDAGFFRIVNAYLVLTRPDPRGYQLDELAPRPSLEVPKDQGEYLDWWLRRFSP